jgi:hypothetical protein
MGRIGQRRWKIQLDGGVFGHGWDGEEKEAWIHLMGR